MKIKIISIAILSIFTAKTQASEVLIDAIGKSWQPQGWAIGGQGDMKQAFAFKPTFSGTASDASFVAFYLGGENSIDFSLLADNNGLPGIKLETHTIVNQLTTGLMPSAPIHVKLDQTTKLNEGTQYWVELSATNRNNGANWNNSSATISAGWSLTNLSTTMPRAYAYTDWGNQWSVWYAPQTPGAFSISVVPEPASAILCSMGVALTACIRRKKLAIKW